MSLVHRLTKFKLVDSSSVSLFAVNCFQLSLWLRLRKALCWPRPIGCSNTTSTWPTIALIVDCTSGDVSSTFTDCAGIVLAPFHIGLVRLQLYRPYQSGWVFVSSSRSVWFRSLHLAIHLHCRWVFDQVRVDSKGARPVPLLSVLVL